MRIRRLLESTTALVLFIGVICGPVKASHAAAVHLFLTRTTGVTAVADATGSTLYEGGTVTLADSLVGRYVLTIRTVTGITEPQNTGIVTITLLGLGAAPPQNVALVGSHDFASGNETGGIGGSSIRGLTGFTWDSIPIGIGAYRLTLNTP